MALYLRKNKKEEGEKIYAYIVDRQIIHWTLVPIKEKIIKQPIRLWPFQEKRSGNVNHI